MTQNLEFKSFDDVQKHLDGLAKTGQTALDESVNIVQQLTGIGPARNHPIGAMEIYRIARKAAEDLLRERGL